MKDVKNKTQLSFGKNNPFGSQAKLLLHKERLGEYLLTGDTSSPIFMEIGLTNRCNMKCEWCITENGRDNVNGSEINIDALKRYLNDFASIGGKAVTFCGQGESTLYPHFIEAVKAVKDNGLQLGLMSNGVYPDHLNELIGTSFQWARFSVDTIDEEQYFKWKKTRGVSIVKRNVAHLKSYPIRLGVNCNVSMGLTVDHVKELLDWVNEEPSISYIQFRPILPRYYKSNEVVELNKPVWDYLDTQKSNVKLILSDDKRGDILDNNKLFNFKSCEGHFFVPILDADGNVKVCTYHPQNSNLNFGNINEKSFKDIWKSEQRYKAIQYVRNMNYCTECQVCCKLAELNKLIDFINSPKEMQDVNFL